MSNRAWMPLYIADYLADTGHLTATEHGAYMLLIMHYWQNGHLPGNERLIARVACMTAAQWEESRDVIAMLFGPDWTLIVGCLLSGIAGPLGVFAAPDIRRNAP